jgi:hypothetical protein
MTYWWIQRISASRVSMLPFIACPAFLDPSSGFAKL